LGIMCNCILWVGCISLWSCSNIAANPYAYERAASYRYAVTHRHADADSCSYVHLIAL
jgi:hypothetical protein